MCCAEGYRQFPQFSDAPEVLDEGRHTSIRRHFTSRFAGEKFAGNRENSFAIGTEFAFHQTTTHCVPQVFARRSVVLTKLSKTARLLQRRDLIGYGNAR